MDPHSRAPKKNTSRGNEVLLHVTNDKVRAKIQQTIGPHEDLLTIAKRRIPYCSGMVMSPVLLAKTFLQGTVKGERRQGRHRKNLKHNIREWTDLEFAKSQRAVENTGKWRKLVAKSSVVPERPSRLRDWWDEMRSKELLLYTQSNPQITSGRNTLYWQ